MLMAGCSGTGQYYKYEKRTYEAGELTSIEKCKTKTHHRNQFTKKSADEIRSECSVANVKSSATKYGAEIQPEAIEATETPIVATGEAVGTGVGAAVRRTVTP